MQKMGFAASVDEKGAQSRHERYAKQPAGVLREGSEWMKGSFARRRERGGPDVFVTSRVKEDADRLLIFKESKERKSPTGLGEKQQRERINICWRRGGSYSTLKRWERGVAESLHKTRATRSKPSIDQRARREKWEILSVSLTQLRVRKNGGRRSR